MSTKHSPAPWSIKGELTRRTLKDGRNKSIVVIERWTSDADAALIAAAPDLLAALQSLASHIGRTDLAWEDTPARRRVEIEDRLKARALAAIAKAGGE